MDDDLKRVVCDALQVAIENRIGGYTMDYYGEKAEALVQYLTGQGYEIVNKD